jgi:hypothetical protein
MTRIVRTAYHYKRPPGKKKPVKLSVGRVVKAIDRSKASKRVRRPMPASGKSEPPPTPANDGPKPALPQAAIVTVRRRGRFGEAGDLTDAELRRRADAADAMMEEFKLQIAKEKS